MNILRNYALDLATGRTFKPSMFSSCNKEYFFLPDSEKIKRSDLVCHICNNELYIKALESNKKVTHFAGTCNCHNIKSYKEEVERIIAMNEPLEYLKSISVFKLEDYSLLRTSDGGLELKKITFDFVTDDKKIKKIDNVVYYMINKDVVAIKLTEEEVVFHKSVVLVNTFLNGKFKYHSRGSYDKFKKELKEYEEARSIMHKKTLEQERIEKEKEENKEREATELAIKQKEEFEKNKLRDYENKMRIVEKLIEKTYDKLTFVEFTIVRAYKQLNSLNADDMSGPCGYLWTGQEPLFVPCLKCGSTDLCTCYDK